MNKPCLHGEDMGAAIINVSSGRAEHSNGNSSTKWAFKTEERKEKREIRQEQKVEI